MLRGDMKVLRYHSNPLSTLLAPSFFLSIMIESPRFEHALGLPGERFKIHLPEPCL